MGGPRAGGGSLVEALEQAGVALFAYMTEISSVERDPAWSRVVRASGAEGSICSPAGCAPHVSHACVCARACECAGTTVCARARNLSVRVCAVGAFGCVIVAGVGVRAGSAPVIRRACAGHDVLSLVYAYMTELLVAFAVDEFIGVDVKITSIDLERFEIAAAWFVRADLVLRARNHVCTRAASKGERFSLEKHPQVCVRGWERLREPMPVGARREPK